jgi:hypothetical protein
MTQITRAIALSISQFSDRRFQRAVLKSIVLATFALWALAAGGGSVLGWLFSGDLTLPWIGTITFNGSLIGWGAFWIILGLSMFLMVPVASAMSAFFVDDVARAVEDRHYPITQAQYRSKLSEEVRESLGFLGDNVGGKPGRVNFLRTIYRICADYFLVIERIFDWTRIFLYGCETPFGARQCVIRISRSALSRMDVRCDLGPTDERSIIEPISSCSCCGKFYPFVSRVDGGP